MRKKNQLAEKDAATDTEIFIDDGMLQKLLRFDAELKNALLTIQLADAKWQLQTHAHTSAMKTLEQAKNDINAEFKNVVSQIEKEYSVDMRKYVYSTDTGALTRIDNV